MQDLALLEKRIAAALQRIGEGLDALAAPTSRLPDDIVSRIAAQDTEIARLAAELAAERSLAEDLRQRLAQAEEAATSHVSEVPSPPQDVADLQARIDRMTAQLDVQGLEMQRMRKTVVQLRENLRGLRRAQAANVADPEQINRAMAAELEAMRVARLSEVAEMDEILGELTPLIKEERADA